MRNRLVLDRSSVENFDLSHLRPYVVSPEEFYGPNQHYKLLAYLASTLPRGAKIIDVGTHLGDSALALSCAGHQVLSFDIEDKRSGRSVRPESNITFFHEDLWHPPFREIWSEELLGSALIFVDIDPHEGTRELSLVRWLQRNEYAGIIVLDDIWFFPGMRKNLWDLIPSEFKTDATAVGHWSGTGIVSFSTQVSVDRVDQEVLCVSAFVPIPVKHLNPSQYRELGDKLIDSVRPRRFTLFEHSLEGCWLSDEPGLPMVPAAPVPFDRYATPEDNVKSHIVQHNRTEWALRASEQNPDAHVIVWFDYGVMKQGAWNGNLIESAHIREFLDRVSEYSFSDSMPFPGIEPKKPIDAHGNNWRFCGSTHIWPVKWLPTIDRVYKQALRDFIAEHKRVPLDLAIWPEVENRCAAPGPDHVPFLQYRAEYDSSQLLGFPKKDPT